MFHLPNRMQMNDGIETPSTVTGDTSSKIRKKSQNEGVLSICYKGVAIRIDKKYLK